MENSKKLLRYLPITIIGIIVLILIINVISGYNSMVGLREDIDAKDNAILRYNR